jgi:ABC-type nickel/cobalt efflux system permease component RcnA
MVSRWIIGFLFALLLASGQRANAHPLGNFSINQYSALTVGRDSIAVRYVVDMAEIPTFQELQANGIIASADHPDTRAYLERQVRLLGDGLSAEVNGQHLKLQPDSRDISFPAGAGGLPTLRIAVSFLASRSEDTAGPYSLSYRDGNFPDRVGWKEIIARPAPGAQLMFSSVGESDRSAELTNYAADLLNSPPQVLETRIVFSTAVESPPVAHTTAPSSLAGDTTRPATSRGPQPVPQTAPVSKIADRTPANETIAVLDAAEADLAQPAYGEVVAPQITKTSTPRNTFTELMSAQASGWSFLLFAFIAAVGLGAFHALEPGHGKTLVAAYLVGAKGTIRHALLLGLVVTAAHTAGVYLLGAIALYASRYIVPERLYPILEIVSGIVITVLGTTLLIKRYQGKHSGHSHYHHRHKPHTHNHFHRHEHGHHNEDHEHEDVDHEHNHDHDHEKHGSVSVRELLGLGLSGGIVPCPAALVVLLSAVSMNRAGFALLLIVAFSAGLAAVLIAIGLLVVYARHFMARFQRDGTWVTRWLPITSSAFIVFLGIALIWKALQSAGFARWII